MYRYLPAAMPRGPRLDAPGALHHVIARGIERRKIFLDDADRSSFVARLGNLALETESSIYAWTVLPNHFHLLLQSGTAPLSTLMRRLLTGHAVRFNRRHNRSGCLFQNRFKSVVVEQEPYFLELVRYIHLNPLRARLVADLNALDSYPWSGHAGLLGHAGQPWHNIDFVLARFGPRLDVARQRYRNFVAVGVVNGQRHDLAGGGLRRSLLGWKFTEALERGRERWAFDERILGSGEFVLRVLDEASHTPKPAAIEPAKVLPELVSKAADRCGLGSVEITGNSHRPAAVRARALVSYVAICRWGFNPTVVARYLGVSRYSVLRGLQRARQIGLHSDAEALAKQIPHSPLAST